MQRGLGLAKAKSKDDVDLPLQSAECSLRMLLWLAALECCRLQGRPMAPTGVGAGIRPASGPRDLGCGPVPPPPKKCFPLNVPLTTSMCRAVSADDPLACKTPRQRWQKPGHLCSVHPPPSTDIHPIAICIARLSKAIKSPAKACRNNSRAAH